MSVESPLPAAKYTLLAGICLTTVLGSIHAFSVFLEPLETLFDSGRARVSLIYSGALICLTVSVLFGHHIYRRLSAPNLAFVACLAAAVGIYIAGQSTNYWLTVLGYSVIFGGANGVGYGFALQISAQAMPTRQGFAMGTVTAFYALGATTAPFLFNTALTHGGLPSAMTSAGAVFLIAGGVAWYLLKKAGAKFASESSTQSSSNSENKLLQGFLWLGYGSGALAGLMIIGHATGIIQSAGGSTAFAVGGIIVIAFGNMLGGLAAGVLADRVRIGTLLIMLPLVSAAVLALSATSENPTLLLVGLVLIGFTYGAIIAVYPVAVIARFGAEASSRIYGRVFTAWGLAGLLGPWLAGVFYDTSGAYKMAIFAACICSALSALVGCYLNNHIETKNLQVEAQ